MATQYINQASAKVTIDGQEINFQSNTVTAEKLDASLVTMVKIQSKEIVTTGSSITYTVTITNLSVFPIANLVFSDIIPTGMTYTDGSFKVNLSSKTPTVTGQNLSYTIASILVGVTTVSFDCTVA